MFQRIKRTELCAAVFVGLALRLIGLGLVHHTVDAGDAILFNRLAHNLMSHGVFSISQNEPFVSSTFRPPLLPAFIAMIFEIFGDHIFAFQLASILINVGSGLLITCIAGALKPELIRPVVWAIMLSPFAALISGAMETENLCQFFLTLACFIVVVRPTRWGYLLCGVSLGLTCLTRDVYVLLPICLAAVIMLKRDAASRRVVLAGLMLVGWAAVVAPWTIRNRIVCNENALISKGTFGLNLWIGTWETNPSWFNHGFALPFPNEAYQDVAERVSIDQALKQTQSDSTREVALGDATFKKSAIRRIRAEPLGVLWRWAIRYPRLWLGTRSEAVNFEPAFLERGSSAWFVIKGALWLLNATILVAAISGVWLAGRRSAWLVAPIVYNAAVYVPFHNTEPRYVEPVFLIVVLFAIYFMHSFAGRWRQRATRRLLPSEEVRTLLS